MNMLEALLGNDGHFTTTPAALPSRLHRCLQLLGFPMLLRQLRLQLPGQRPGCIPLVLQHPGRLLIGRALHLHAYWKCRRLPDRPRKVMYSPFHSCPVDHQAFVPALLGGRNEPQQMQRNELHIRRESASMLGAGSKAAGMKQ